MPDASRPQQRVEVPAAVAAPVVSHHSLDGDPERVGEGEAARHERARGAPPLVGQRLGVSDPVEVVHGNAQAQRPAPARRAPPSSRPCGAARRGAPLAAHRRHGPFRRASPAPGRRRTGAAQPRPRHDADAGACGYARLAASASGASSIDDLAPSIRASVSGDVDLTSLSSLLLWSNHGFAAPGPATHLLGHGCWPHLPRGVGQAGPRLDAGNQRLPSLWRQSCVIALGCCPTGGSPRCESQQLTARRRPPYSSPVRRKQRLGTITFRSSAPRLQHPPQACHRENGRWECSAKESLRSLPR